MTSPKTEIAAALPCHRCTYDLRAQPQDGVCPECGASVAEAVRVNAIPLRPRWRDSDPRWRRRMLAGVWLLVFLPLLDVLQQFELSPHIPVPSLIGSHDPHRTLDYSLLGDLRVYLSIVFCMGIALLFSKEKGRRHNRLDWTRRYGVACAYIALLISFADVLFIGALVMLGIAALFLSMPPKYQPDVTQSFVDISSTYMRYGPHPMEAASVTLVAASSLAILLACIALYQALRSTGPRWVAMLFLSPLALFASLHLVQLVRQVRGLPNMFAPDIYHYGVFFHPELFVQQINYLSKDLFISTPDTSATAIEAIKWGTILSIAIWLSIAQLAAAIGRGRVPRSR